MTAAVRVRFAPSPTGFLHVGGARTALFNWLYARHHGGRFVLRIEDTDFSRSSEEMVEGILKGMRWLGLDWDEGPFFQSHRLPRYRELADRLLEIGRAYRCFCTPGDLAERRGRNNRIPEGPGYTTVAVSGSHVPNPTRAQQQAVNSPSDSGVPEGKTSFEDGVFGRIEIENANIEDFVLLRSEGIPTYHLGVVVDDLDMAITHVIRGADHISNTPKQILLYQAAEGKTPEFAHLPLILGPDKQRLSKRHGATSVMAYAEMGYIPSAFFNFLALLGWSPGDDTELMDREELIRRFSLEGVGKANAIFGLEKLDWFNAQYLQTMSLEKIAALLKTELISTGIWKEGDPDSDVSAALGLLRTRIKRLSDFSGSFRAFFSDEFEYDTSAIEKFLREPRLVELLSKLRERYAADPEFGLESAERRLREVAAECGVKAGLMINALRVALTGQGVAPGLFEVMVVLGRDRTLARIDRALKYMLTANR